MADGIGFRSGFHAALSDVVAGGCPTLVYDT